MNLCWANEYRWESTVRKINKRKAKAGSDRSQQKPEKESRQALCYVETWKQRWGFDAGRDGEPVNRFEEKSACCGGSRKGVLLDINSSVERNDGKREDQRWAESSLALIARKSSPLALSHLVLLEASQQHGFPCGKGNKVWLQKKGGVKSLRSCKKNFGNCAVDFAKRHRYGVQSKVLLCFAGFIGSYRSYLLWNTAWCWEWMSVWPQSLVTHLDVTLLDFFLLHSAGGIKGRDFSFYTTSTKQLHSLAKPFPGPSLAPWMQWLFGLSQVMLGTRVFRDSNRRDFTWYVVHSVQEVNKEQHTNDSAQEISVTVIWNRRLQGYKMKTKINVLK